MGVKGEQYGGRRVKGGRKCEVQLYSFRHKSSSALMLLRAAPYFRKCCLAPPVPFQEKKMHAVLVFHPQPVPLFDLSRAREFHSGIRDSQVVDGGVDRGSIYATPFWQTYAALKPEGDIGRPDPAQSIK